MFEVFKEARKIAKEKKEFEKERKILINGKTDFGILERFVQKINQNPNLKIKVTTTDGAVYELYTYIEKPHRAPRFTGIAGVEEQEI